MPANSVSTVKLSRIVFDDTIYPRAEHKPPLVQRYAKAMAAIEDAGNFIRVTQDMRILDGKHRWLAYRTIHGDNDPDIQVIVEDIESGLELTRALELNNSHGDQLSEDDKRRNAIRLWGEGKSKGDIAAALSLHHKTVADLLSRTIKEDNSKIKKLVLSMWQECYSEEEIAKHVEKSRPFVRGIVENRPKPENYNTDDFTPPIYNVWKTQNKTNTTGHFGNSEQQWLDNLLYMYTDAGQIVVDPFAGGASTLDVCRKRGRRCYISDRKPIVAREHEIRQHDLIGEDGNVQLPSLTGRWGDVGLVYLDPPYWRQAAGQYSDDPTDLANVELDAFHNSMASIITKFAARAKSAHIAMILQPTQWKADDRQYTDHILEIAKRVKLDVAMRISAPYESQQCTAQMVNWAKENKTVLVLSREIVVWSAHNAAS